MVQAAPASHQPCEKHLLRSGRLVPWRIEHMFVRCRAAGTRRHSKARMLDARRSRDEGLWRRQRQSGVAPFT